MAIYIYQFNDLFSDMMILRETDKFNRSTDGQYSNSNPNFVSISTIVPRI
jgi:hypothetical protein